MTLFPLSECCLHLGVDPKTLRCWLKAAQLAACLHPTDARVKCLTSEQLAHVAHLHDRRLPEHEALTPLRPADPPAEASDTEVAALRQTVSDLQSQLQTLQTQFTDLTLTLLQRLPSVPLHKLPRNPPQVAPAQDPSVPPPPSPAPSKRPLPQALIEARADGSYAIISQQEGLLSLVPDSPAWFAWLASLRSFRFQGRLGSYSATRKVKDGRLCDAWNIHTSGNGRSCSLYLSLFPAVTIARLEEMAVSAIQRLTRT